MPIEPSYVSAVLAAYRAGAARMGAFPGPSREVIVAAEVLKPYVNGTPMSAAVEVVEIGGETARKYVIATSGNPNALNDPGRPAPFDNNAANADLTRELKFSAEFVYADEAYEFYQPMHKDAIDAMKKVTPTFNGSSQKVLLADAQNAFQAVMALAQANQGLASPQVPPALNINRAQYAAARGNQVKPATVRRAAPGSNVDNLVTAANARLNVFNQAGTSREMSEAQFQALLGVCLALRLNAVQAGQYTPLWNQFATFLNGLSMTGANRVKTSVDGLYRALPAQLLAVAGKQEARPAALGDSSLDRWLDKIWDTLNRSRYCAEPRAFAYLSKQSVDGRTASVRSQTCFWWGGAGPAPRDNPPEYRVIGPQANRGNGALSGSYMWPCTSCKNRSEEMLRGLGVAAATRARSSSLTV